MALLERLRVESLAVEQPADPWLAPLQRVRGKIGDDGIERITTQTLFDILEVPQRSRGAGASRRLAKLMITELGWSPVRVRGLYARRLSRTSSWLRPRRASVAVPHASVQGTTQTA